MNKAEAANNIIVALDCTEARARELAKELQGQASWLKVGMTLFYQTGPGFVKELKDAGYNVFLDLKLHDIPHQVEGAAKAAVATGADILSIHAFGGPAMIEAATHGAHSQNPKAKVIAITVLTSLDAETLKHLGIATELSAEATQLAQMSVQAGADGVVCSGLEAHTLRYVLGEEPLIVTPGIRLPANELSDQKRVMSPADALNAGASKLVIGRPITEAPSPAQAFTEAVQNIVENAR